MKGPGRSGHRRREGAKEPWTVAPVPWFGGSPRRMFFFLWFLAFSHRLFLQLGSVDRSWPFPVFYEGDAETFHRFALSLLAGQPYDGGIPFHPPLYPLFLAVCHAVLGNPAAGLVLRIAHGAVYALSVPLLWLWLRRHVTPGAALAGALLASWSFGLALIATSAVSEGLYLLLLLAGLLAFDRLRDATQARNAPRRFSGETAPSVAAGDRRLATRHAVLFGLLGGLLALARAEGLGWSLLLLASGAAMAWRNVRRSSKEAAVRPAVRQAVIPAARPAVTPAGGKPHATGETTVGPPIGAGFAIRSAMLPWAVALAALCVTLAPWTIRNAVVLTRVNRLSTAAGLEPLPTFVVTTAYGPLNFALSNSAGAPGYFTRGALTSGRQRDVLDLTDPQHRDLFLHGYRRGWDWIRSHPSAFGALAGRKLALLARALRLGWTQRDLPGGLHGTRFPVDMMTPDSASAVFVHLALLLTGAWLLLAGKAGQSRVRGRPLLLVTGGYVLFSAAVTVMFFGYARQGIPALALLCGVEGTALAAGGSWLARRVGERGRGRKDTGVSAAAVAGASPDPLVAGADTRGNSRGRLTGPRVLAGVIVLLWAIELVGAFQGRDFIATGETQAGSKMLNRDSIMYLSPKPR